MLMQKLIISRESIVFIQRQFFYEIINFVFSYYVTDFFDNGKYVIQKYYSLTNYIFISS